MPDVPERCPFCNSGDRREETWRGMPAYSFSCGTVLYANGEVALRYFFCYALEDEREKQAIREQLAAARAEVERWRKRYEELRAGVELVLKQIEAAPKPEEFIPTNQDEMMTELIYAMKGGRGHNKGFANGLWVAGMMLRGLLAEAGGDSQ